MYLSFENVKIYIGENDLNSEYQCWYELLDKFRSIIEMDSGYITLLSLLKINFSCIHSFSTLGGSGKLFFFSAQLPWVWQIETRLTIFVISLSDHHHWLTLYIHNIDKKGQVRGLTWTPLFPGYCGWTFSNGTSHLMSLKGYNVSSFLGFFAYIAKIAESYISFDSTCVTLNEYEFFLEHFIAKMFQHK